MIAWTPHAPPLAVAALAAAGAVALWWAHRRLTIRLAGRPAWGVTACRAATLALLVLALLDPGCTRTRGDRAERNLYLVVDDSASMAVRDAGGRSRFERATALADRLAAGVPEGVRVVRRWCGTALRPNAQPAPAGGTDLGWCLQQLAREAAAGDPVGAVLISDGGDEPLAVAGAPELPLCTVAVGGDPARLANLRIDAVQAPPAVERGLGYEIAVECAAQGEAAFLGRAGAVALTLSERKGDGWAEIQRQAIDLRGGRARHAFKLQAGAEGLVRWQVAVAPLAGEASLLDNQRELAVEIQARSLRVLYAATRLGLDLKRLRTELGRDPGVAFAALYRTVGGRWALQGNDNAGALGQGLGAPQALAGVDVLVLAPAPAAEWGSGAMARVAEWCAAGGGLVLLGGEGALGAQGWGVDPTAALLPWQPAADGGLLRLDAPVAVPPAAAAHPVVRGVDELLGGARLASLNRPGPVKPGAQTLLAARLGGEEVPVLASQAWGKGRVLGIATDTLWRLARDQAGEDAYGRLWRQAVRWLADRGEGGRVLRVAWDQARWRPGDTAMATLRAAEPGLRLRAALTAPDGRGADLAPARAGEDAWSLAVPLAGRGDYTVSVAASRDGTPVEEYRKILVAAPGLPEGARLARDDDGLARLAAARGGASAGEEDPAPVAAWITARARGRAVTVVRSLVHGGPWWIILLAACMAGEWYLRRRRNLI